MPSPAPLNKQNGTFRLRIGLPSLRLTHRRSSTSTNFFAFPR